MYTSVHLGTNSVMCQTVRQNNIFMIYDIKVGFSCIIDSDMLLDYFQQPLRLRMVWVNTLMVAFFTVENVVSTLSECASAKVMSR